MSGARVEYCAFGSPLSFWAQIRLPDDPERLAYVVLDVNDAIPDGDPLPSTGCVFIQPGGAPEGDRDPVATGPVVPYTTEHDGGWDDPIPWDFDARVPSLSPFEEPRSWEDVGDLTPSQERAALNKVGGTPRYVQNAHQLPDGWTFLCQFGAWDAGFELADGAECYVYIDPATSRGVLTWD